MTKERRHRENSSDKILTDKDEIERYL